MTLPSGLAATALLLLAADGHRQTDKAKHFLLSAFYGATVGLTLRDDPRLGPGRRVAWSALLGSTPGLVKEYLDEGEPGNRFDYADLWADLAGALAGALLAESLIDPTPEAGRRLDYAWGLRPPSQVVP